MPEDEPLNESAENDPLDAGIRAAFALDPEIDAPKSRSVLRVFRRKGQASRVSLRDADSPEMPVILSARARDPEKSWTESRYQVSGEIARGGVGSVLKARDVDLGREVALKVLLDAHRGNAEMTTRFLEEAQIGGQLEHPGIVPVHEIGLLADDRPYFAMKLVKGQTLAELLESRASVDEERQRFLGIFEQVCQTLAYAHTRGVIHRDLKPANIMVGAFGEVQVMDWGLAKILANARSVDASQTTNVLGPRSDIRTSRTEDPGTVSLAGSIMGTPAYMPPEQARGAVDELDERADVFGLGAILCEILTGRPPYIGKSSDAVFGQAKVADLSDARRRLEACGADKELVDLAVSCLRADARERPRNALVVAKRVRGYLESLDRRARELQVRAARTRLKLLLVLVVLTAVVLGGGGYLWVDKDRHAREQEVVAAVNDTMARAKELRAQATSARDLSLWDASLREALRAVSLAEKRVSPGVFDDARKLHGEIAAQVQDQRTVVKLENLREERDSDPEELEHRFREVFSGYGIDVDDVAAAASAVRESSITKELVLALDQWAVTNRFGPRRRARTRLLEIAQLADDDFWRKRLRDAVKDDDQEQLASLAENAATRPLEPSTLEVLAFALRDPERTRQVWLRAQDLHPDDFWINVRLGDYLLKRREARDAVQYLRAAAALRPSSSYALYKLGAALVDSEAYAEAFRHLKNAILLDPRRRSGSAYAMCARLVEENGERIPAAALDDLLARLERIVESGAEHHEDGLTRLQAAILFASGDPKKAILTLERSLRVRKESSRRGFGWSRRGHESRGEILKRYRDAMLPDLVSYASVDAVESREPEADHIAAFRRLQAGREDDRSRALLLYLDGRELQRAGKHREAATRFEEVVALDDSLPEPFLRLVESLRAAGETARAEVTLRHALGRETMQYAEPWKLWATLSLVDLGRSAAEALAVFPERAAEPAAEDLEAGEGADLRWGLENIAVAGALFINCGGDSYVDEDGVTWGRDRFHGPESMPFSGRRELSESGDDPLRRTWRWFHSRSRRRTNGYEIPLPAGRYEVSLRFAEFSWPRRGRERRERDEEDEEEDDVEVEVDLEGETARAAADAWRHRIAVSDGFLDISFARRRWGHRVSAIEVRKLD